MKKLFFATALCSMLLVVAAFVLAPRGRAQSDLVISLLSFPAPPPKGTVFEPAPPKKPEDFYSKSKVPEDDAPIEVLMDYWGYMGIRTWEAGYFPKPSDTVLGRIKDEIEIKPGELTKFFKILPVDKATAAWVKKLYDDEVSARTLAPDWRSVVRDWLLRNSTYFSDELLKLAEGVKDDENGYITGQTELIALARVDWDKAKPLVDRLLNDSSQPNSQVVAKWARYVNALSSGSESDIEKSRSELQRIVEDKNASPAQRDLALDALVKEKDWPGRDEWYFSLFSDETLLNLKTKTQTLTGLTTMITESAPDKHKRRLLQMIESGDPNIRGAAAQALSRLAESDIEAATAMLPWLDDPNWARDSNDARATFVKSLANHSIPESVPGLIALLDESLPGKVRRTDANTAAGGPPDAQGNTAPAAEGDDAALHPFRPLAIQALEKQRDGRAVPALRRIFFEGLETYPGPLVNAIHACGGFTPGENVIAVESNIRGLIESEKNANVPYNPDNEEKKSATEEGFTQLGYILGNASEVSDETARLIAERIEQLDQREPSVATRLRAQLAKWRGAGVNLALLQFLKKGTSDADGVVRLLIDRKTIRDRQSSYVAEARAGNPYAEGIAACILEDVGAYDAILEGKNPQTRAALYACARMIRAELPFEKAAADMNSKDGVLSLSAEKYVETVDTPEARALVLSKHKGEARILGALYFFEGLGAADAQKANLIAELVRSVEPSLDTSAEGFDVSNFYVTNENFESDARRIVQTDKQLIRLFVFKKYMLRQYPDRVLLSREDKTGARFWERELRPGEFETFESVLSAERFEEAKPVLSVAIGYSEDPEQSENLQGTELLVLTRDGGRRFYSKTANPPRLLQEIEALLKGMASEGGRLRYHFEMDIPGAETVYIGDELRAATLWKSGSDLRVLVNNLPEEKRISGEMDRKEEEDSAKPDFNADTGYQDLWELRQRRRWESFSWYYVADQSLGAPAPQPEGVEFIPPRDAEGYRIENDGWKARTAGIEIRADQTGIFKIAGGQTTKLRSGGYSMPVISSDGRWVIAQKLDSSGEAGPGDAVVKINIATRAEKSITYGGDLERREPIAYIPSLGKFLLLAGYYEEHEGGAPPPDVDDISPFTYEDMEFYLLDPVTNSVTKTETGFAAFAHQTFRPLQPTGRLNEFWAALPSFDYQTSAKVTRIGVINAKTGRFRAIYTLNKVFFDSMALWVDDRVYFAYQGHVVSIPKPKLPAAP